MSRPKILDVLGSSRSPRTFSDAHLKALYLYLFMSLLETNEEMKRRGLSNGEALLQVGKPE